MEHKYNSTSVANMGEVFEVIAIIGGEIFNWEFPIEELVRKAIQNAIRLEDDTDKIRQHVMSRIYAEFDRRARAIVDAPFYSMKSRNAIIDLYDMILPQERERLSNEREDPDGEE